MKLPVDDNERLDLVGSLLFGKSYRRKLAKVLGVSATLVYNWPPLDPGLLNEYLLAAVMAEMKTLRRRDKVLIALLEALRQLPGRSQ